MLTMKSQISLSDYDLIVFDTAPTGHTLRLLALPETLSGWLGRILKLRLKLGKMFGALKRMFTREEKKEDNSLETLEVMSPKSPQETRELTILLLCQMENQL